MKRLTTTIGWDLRLLLRHHIPTVAALVTVMYILVFSFLPEFEGRDLMVIILIFSDPSALGFMFVGAIILFEKDAYTLPALVVTPIRPWQYIWSKMIALTLIALPCSLIMAFFGVGWPFNPFWLILAVILSSFLFLQFGIIGVVQVKSLNQYLILIPLYFIPLMLPLLDFLGLASGAWFYLFPTHGLLILFKAAFGPVPWPDLIYAVLYPSLFIALMHPLTLHFFDRHIKQTA